MLCSRLIVNLLLSSCYAMSKDMTRLHRETVDLNMYALPCE